MTAPSPPVPAEDTEAASSFAALVLFTTPPSDRALAGWDPSGWADEEIAVLRWYAATRSGVVR